MTVGIGAGRPVNSLDAHAQMCLVMHTLAQHRRGEYALSRIAPSRGRLATQPTGAVARQVRAHGTVVRIVSIAESFANQQLVTRLEMQAPPPRTQFIESLYVREENNAVSSWDKIRENYKKWVDGVQLVRCDKYEVVMTFVEARNAIVHGLGALTKRQVRAPSRAALIDSLTALDITVDRVYRLTISEDAVKKAALACRAFISSLDLELANVSA